MSYQTKKAMRMADAIRALLGASQAPSGQGTPGQGQWCGRSPSDEPSIALTRLNPKGIRGVFQCQHCVTDRDEAHSQLAESYAAIREVPRICLCAGGAGICGFCLWREQHAPVIARASEANIRRAMGETKPEHRLECASCHKAPTDDPQIALTRVNVKGVPGVFLCHWCNANHHNESSTGRAMGEGK